ncbi:MAG: putative bacteriophage-related protein [Bryobacterales bacterium]|nr:putative bacteriophage-related protein [Bryobacterales bacterium]
MNLSARAVAEHLGVSHTAVNKAAERGRIKREPDGGFDLDKVKAAWNENVNIHQQARGAGSRPVAAEPAALEPPPLLSLFDDDGHDESRFSTAKIQRLAELEKLARLRRENAIASGELLNRAETVGVFAQIGKIYGAAREALPDELAPQLMGKNIDEIERIIATVLAAMDERVCREIAAKFPALLNGNNDAIDTSRVAA